MATAPDRWLLLLNAAASLFMVGLIWFVQVVHYPLFGRVEGAVFGEYARQHQRRTTWVVVVPMFLEAATAALLLLHPGPCSTRLLWAGMALVIIIWLSTALLQVPRHTELRHGFELEAHRLLVLTNWIRTACWTARGVLVLILLSQAMR